MGTYGFHGLHGRALPIAQGVRIRRPDLNVFVNMGDGDCCSIGTAHWIHSIRYNMNIVAIVHDNEIYGMTKMQASPTSPKGLKTYTTPRGAYLDPLNILTATLGISNVSFVANAVEWIPDLLYETIKRAYLHRGFSFVRVAQRCPHFLPNFFDPLITDLDKILVLNHPAGIELPDEAAKLYKNQDVHDPSNIHRAREIAHMQGIEPVGILYQNEDIACYDDVRRPKRVFTVEKRKAALDTEFDKFAVQVVDLVSRNGVEIGSDGAPAH
jgi:2-oxoglutarate ferredoxin oxidoreductase subunit beta